MASSSFEAISAFPDFFEIILTTSSALRDLYLLAAYKIHKLDVGQFDRV